jgi:hypothetical protein
MAGLFGSLFAELGHELIVVFTKLNRYSQKIESCIVAYLRRMLSSGFCDEQFRSYQELPSAILFEDAIVIDDNRFRSVQKGITHCGTATDSRFVICRCR